MAIQFNHLPVVPLRITSGFGSRDTGIVGATTYHQGIDLGADKSKPQTPVLAVKTGTVLQNYWNDVRGWVMVIRHNGFDTLYQHLKSQSPLAVGSNVFPGQTLGIMGASSKTLSIAIHLHFELHLGGIPIDPEPYLLNIISEENEDMTEEQVRKIVQEEIKRALAGGDTPSTWAKEEMEEAVKLGITDGTHPTGYATREQAVAMILRAMKE